MNGLLRSWRERRGWSLRELGQRSGVSYVNIQRIEQGQMNPTVATLERLAVALGIRVRDLFPTEPPRSGGGDMSRRMMTTGTKRVARQVAAGRRSRQSIERKAAAFTDLCDALGWTETEAWARVRQHRAARRMSKREGTR